MSAEPSIHEILERIDHTRAQLESQLKELHRAKGSDVDLQGLSGHLLGLAVVAMRLDGATNDDMRTLLNMTLSNRESR